MNYRLLVLVLLSYAMCVRSAASDGAVAPLQETGEEKRERRARAWEGYDLLEEIERDSVLAVEYRLKHAANPKDLLCKTGLYSKNKESPAIYDARSAEMVYLLVRYGADVEQLDSEYGTPLRAGVLASDDGKSKKCAINSDALQALIRCGANVNFVDPYTKKSALYVAVSVGNVRAVACLLRNGADPEYKTARNDSLLVWAAMHPGMTELLLAHNLDPNDYQPCGQEFIKSPLSVAATHNNFSGVQALLAAGARLNPVHPKDTYTALHGAICKTRLRMVDFLLKKRAVIQSNDLDVARSIAQDGKNNPTRHAVACLVLHLLETHIMLALV